MERGERSGEEEVKGKETLERQGNKGFKRLERKKTEAEVEDEMT